MGILLDTHAFLWMLDGDSRLSDTAIDTCKNRDNALYLSAASLWEIGIKTSLHKLELAPGWPEVIREEIRLNAIQWLPIELTHCTALQDLPFHHRDPFDRMLVAQATVEDLTLLSRDKQLHAYDIECRW